MTLTQFVILTTAATGTLFFVIFMLILLLPHKKEMYKIPPPPLPLDPGYKWLLDQYDNARSIRISNKPNNNKQ